MSLTLSLKLLRDGELRNWPGIEFHSLGAVYEYDLSNNEERDLGTANAPILKVHSRLKAFCLSVFSGQCLCL